MMEYRSGGTAREKKEKERRKGEEESVAEREA
jgi:hypothetical protein